MELTPIKIPGKRRRKGEIPVSLDKVQPKKLKTKSKREKKVSAPKASYLEKELPLEVVERIFWMSENVGFPRSGPRVGQLLSGEPTRRETFLQAFGPTWDVWFGCFRDESLGLISSYHNWQVDSSRFGGNPEFQSAILQYSWVTISFILECMDLWVRRFARDRLFHHEKLWGNPSTPNQLDDDPGGITHFGLARQYFQHDYEAFCSLKMPLFIDASWIEVHFETQIPDILVTGPWDEDARQKLFWLYRAGARLSTDQTWEVTLEGYHNAMASETDPPSGNIEIPVIRLLLILGFSDWPHHVVELELRKLVDLATSLFRSGLLHVYRKYDIVENMMRARILD
ncbi:hypothetical protein BJ170DRAFT_474203 [Xylariales sp. AK1849]|nr:hypothetical protein BJ170DRAFT_474203 [Xylariales sp. AK1849]